MGPLKVVVKNCNVDRSPAIALAWHGGKLLGWWTIKAELESKQVLFLWRKKQEKFEIPGMRHLHRKE